MSNAKTKLRVAAVHQKKYLDGRTAHHIFQPGDFVYMENPTLGKPEHKSMDPRYIGPFEILKRVGNTSFQLELPRTMARRFPTVPENKLLKFKDRETGLPFPTKPIRDIVLTPTEDSDEENVQIPEDGPKEIFGHRTVSYMKKFLYAELQVIVNGHKTWKRVGGDNGLISNGWWKCIHDYCSNNTTIKECFPLFKLVKSTIIVKNAEKTLLGYITRHDFRENVKKPYLADFQDSKTVEDLTLKELQNDSRAAEFHGSTRLMLIQPTEMATDKEYWVFPLWLAKLYSIFTGRYTLDAMEHSSGLSSKADHFCSANNSVFIHDLVRHKTWCNPAFSLICRFIKHFLAA